MKKILSITGIRSEYDFMSPVYQAIDQNENLELRLIVAGSHLSENYQMTIGEIKKDGFNIVEEIETLLDSDGLSARYKSMAIEMMGVVQTIKRVHPDILLAVGDREEAIVMALAGSYLNIPIAHIGGGDIVVGNVDDAVRHAVTKLSHLHFAICEDSAERIKKMGEEAWRVFSVGFPGLDRIRQIPEISRGKLSKKLGFELSDGPIIVLIQHPVSSEFTKASKQLALTFEAIRDLGIQTLIGHPNSDAGGKSMINTINEYSRQLNNVFVYKNLPRFEFVNLLREASVLVGNSSLGISEAPFLGLPVVNIGTRQKKRFHGDNILFVEHEKTEIIEAIKKSLFDEAFKTRAQKSKTIFGNGFASNKIVELLEKFEVNEKLLVKDWAY